MLPGEARTGQFLAPCRETALPPGAPTLVDRSFFEFITGQTRMLSTSGMPSPRSVRRGTPGIADLILKAALLSFIFARQRKPRGCSAGSGRYRAMNFMGFSSNAVPAAGSGLAPMRFRGGRPPAPATFRRAEPIGTGPVVLNRIPTFFVRKTGAGATSAVATSSVSA